MRILKAAVTVLVFGLFGLGVALSGQTRIASMISDQGVSKILSAEVAAQVKTLFGSDGQFVLIEVPASEFPLKAAASLPGLLDRIAATKSASWVVHFSLEKGATAENVSVSVYSRETREVVLNAIEMIRTEADVKPVVTSLCRKIRQSIRAELLIPKENLFLPKSELNNPYCWQVKSQKLQAGNCLLYVGLLGGMTAALAIAGLSPSEDNAVIFYAGLGGAAGIGLIYTIGLFASAGGAHPYRVASAPVAAGFASKSALSERTATLAFSTPF